MRSGDNFDTLTIKSTKEGIERAILWTSSFHDAAKNKPLCVDLRPVRVCALISKQKKGKQAGFFEFLPTPSPPSKSPLRPMLCVLPTPRENERCECFHSRDGGRAVEATTRIAGARLAGNDLRDSCFDGSLLWGVQSCRRQRDSALAQSRGCYPQERTEL